MRFLNCVNLAFAAIAIVTRGAIAQSPAKYTEPNTGITFSCQDSGSDESIGSLTWGYALPPDATTVSATEYIGYITSTLKDGAGWAGMSHGGSMAQSLLLVFWANAQEVSTSFRYAGGYSKVALYTGSAKVTQLYSSVNSTHFTLVYRCEGCWSWTQDGVSKNQSTAQASNNIGWALASYQLPDPSNVNTTVGQHQAADAFAFDPKDAANSSYSAWAAKPALTPSASASFTPTATSASISAASTFMTSTTQTATTSSTAVPGTTYDYIVVGGGAGGLTIADKLSEAGKSVLLIERGPPSSYRWGGRDAPWWLQGTNVSRFDVPGLDNEIWINSTGVSCADVGAMAGCVLGGGTAVNAGLWWNVPDIDWDFNFPTGWKSGDIAGASQRVFSRIPGTYTPSMDGKIYLPQGYNLISGALGAAGWSSVSANEARNEKNRTYSHPPWMYSNGERGGPMATYLVTASARPNFKLIMNTDVKRVIRTNGHITGVEVAAYGNGGQTGIINVTPNTGRVILSAGTFGSAKILFRSGIGPTDQLQTVQKSADGPTMIKSDSWINLPVGENLGDHCQTEVVITHPSLQFYDFYSAYYSPISSDAALYKDHREGPFAQSAPNIAPIFWESIYCSDGITRQIQWTARCEGSNSAPNKNAMTLAQNLGRGSTSRGKISIDSSLNIAVTTLPWLQTPGDIEAVQIGISHIRDALTKVHGLQVVSPPSWQSVNSFVSSYPMTPSKRTANHWIGTNKMGTDDGRQPHGTAVVDTDTKVYGTDNLFVVDASIFPGIMSTNPQAMIVTVAEHACERILALA